MHDFLHVLVPSQYLRGLLRAALWPAEHSNRHEFWHCLARQAHLSPSVRLQIEFRRVSVLGYQVYALLCIASLARPSRLHPTAHKVQVSGDRTVTGCHGR
ncbi:hypothetical protein BDW66DRAFT_126615 [Aspergillus desertorum]